MSTLPKNGSDNYFDLNPEEIDESSSEESDESSPLGTLPHNDDDFEHSIENQALKRAGINIAFCDSNKDNLVRLFVKGLNFGLSKQTVLEGSFNADLMIKAIDANPFWGKIFNNYAPKVAIVLSPVIQGIIAFGLLLQECYVPLDRPIYNDITSSDDLD